LPEKNKNGGKLENKEIDKPSNRFWRSFVTCFDAARRAALMQQGGFLHHVRLLLGILRFRPSIGTLSMTLQHSTGEASNFTSLFASDFLGEDAYCLNKFLRGSRNQYSDFTTVLIVSAGNAFHSLRAWNLMYSAWVKIDDSLPWIELKEAFQTRTEAQEAIKEKLSKVKTKIVELPQRTNTMKVSITVKH
jgi:hypothetical protein